LQRKTVLLTTLVIFGLLFTQSIPPLSKSQTQALPRKGAATNTVLIIDYGNTTQESHTGLSGTTVFDILNQSANVTYTQYSYGLFIESINGVSNNEGGSGFYWQYWVNDELAPVAADQYVLLDSDQVLWKYCAPIHTSSNPPSTGTDWWVGIALIACVAGLVIGGAIVISRKLW
jgi:hypothetical protein